MEEYKTKKRWSMRINEKLLQDYLKVCEFLNVNLKEDSYGDNNISINYLINYINKGTQKHYKELIKCRNIAYGSCNKEIVVFINKDEFNNFDNNCKKLNIKKSDAILYFIISIIKYKYNSIVEEKDIINIDVYNKSNIVLKDIIKYNFPIEILSYSLTKNQLSNIKRLVNKNFSSQCSSSLKCLGNMENRYYIFENIYKMRYIFNYAPQEICNCFNRNRRTLQNWLKRMGWEFNLYESQKRTVERGFRDYNKIKQSRKNTCLKNVMKGSLDEEYVRQKINILFSNEFNDYETIIGVNNTSILKDGKELDIPIILINTKTNQFYKFGIEVDGNYWHNNTKRIKEDRIKLETLENKKYKIFSIITNGGTKNNKYYSDLDVKINTVCNNVKDFIKNS